MKFPVVRLDLYSKISKHLFLEKEWLEKCQRKYLDAVKQTLYKHDYDENKEEIFLMHLTANDCYGQTVSRGSLPDK